MAEQREANLISITSEPITVKSMVSDLQALGLQSESVVLVHSSLSKFGWVCGGAVAVILALEEVVGPNGTIIMPTHCGENSDPAKWMHPPVPEFWVDIIRNHMPAFDPDLTPTREMGRIAETFRKQKGVMRSDHPQVSFCAYGKQAPFITSNHHLESGLGEDSPLRKIYDLDGWVLLLGVGHGNNTSLHLAEYRAAFTGKKIVENGCSMLLNGSQSWVKYFDVDLNSDDFELIGEDYCKSHPHMVKKGKVGLSDAILLQQKPLIDFAVSWMEKNRNFIA
ncbi:MAG: AAC(3) family N-acetyltransferase [Anaerolineaceae bacterium]